MKKTAGIVLQVDLVIQSAFWIFDSFYYLVCYGFDELQHLFIITLLFADGVGYAIFALLGGKKIFFVNFSLLVFLFINSILTVTDQMGICDYGILALNILAIFCVILSSKKL
jgi:hypothetical protein